MNLSLKLVPGSSDSYPEQICRQIKEYIQDGRLKPADRLPTLRELQLETGLAPSTVRQAFAELTEEGILVKKNKLGTFVNPALDSVETKKRPRPDLKQFHPAVAGVFGVKQEPVLLKLIQGMEYEFSRYGIKLQLYPLKDRSAMDETDFSRNQVVCFFEDFQTSDASLLRLLNAGKMIVTYEYEGNLMLRGVKCYWYRAVKCLVDHLFDLGHRNIVFASIAKTGSGEPLFRWAAEREQAFLDIMESRNLTASREDIISVSFPSVEEINYKRTGKELWRRIKEKKRSYTAVIAVNDGIAVSMLNEAPGEGLRVPEDYSVAGIDNSMEATIYGLTSAAVPFEKLGHRLALMMIEDYLAGTQKNVGIQMEEPFLVPRFSTGKCAAVPE